MEIHLNPDVEAKLNNIAAARGSEPELLASEAIEHFVNYDEWFLREAQREDSPRQILENS
jgi:predicted transcriptional regulator